jgi:hypothetical protein
VAGRLAHDWWENASDCVASAAPIGGSGRLADIGDVTGARAHWSAATLAPKPRRRRDRDVDGVHVEDPDHRREGGGRDSGSTRSALFYGALGAASYLLVL